jgi:hypothetical protein
LASSPSQAPIVLNVGITGHRAHMLGERCNGALQCILDQVFRELREATLKVQLSDDAFCSVTPAQLRLHTALASGSDQLAAKSARSSGYSIRALLPFSADDYRHDFAIGEERDEFERELDAADEVAALPGDRAAPKDAYVSVGKKMIEASDIIVAIWDGQEGRGPGGTAHVVELALKSAVPVIHIDLDWSSDRIGTRVLVGDKAIEPRRGAHLTSRSYYRLLQRTLSARRPATATA